MRRNLHRIFLLLTLFSLSATTSLHSQTTPAPLSITTVTLPFGTVGVVYSQALTASGGTPPYVWSITSGSLPAGMVLSVSGVLAGTPTAIGTYNFTIRVTDGASPPATATRALTLVVNSGPMVITTSSLPQGTIGTPYSQSLGASGGTPPYAWTITFGSLPAGLALSGSTISGTPTTAGTSNFTIQVRDSGTPPQTAQRALSIVVNASGTPLTSGVTDNQATAHVFPQFADGRFSDGTFYRSTLMISSDNTSPTRCNATLGGLTIPGFGDGTTQTIEIVSGGWVILTSPGTQAIRSGYATLTCSAPVAAQALFSSFSASGVLLSEATVFSSPVATLAQLLADQRNGAQLAVAIANTGSSSADFVIRVIDEMNQELGATIVQIPAQSQVAKFLADLVSVPANFVGKVQIFGVDTNVYTIGLRYTGDIFTTIPVTRRTFR